MQFTLHFMLCLKINYRLSSLSSCRNLRNDKQQLHVWNSTFWSVAYSLRICSAGIGVLNAARKTMARMLGNNESAFESARSQFWVVDAKVRTCCPKIRYVMCKSYSQTPFSLSYMLAFQDLNAVFLLNVSSRSHVEVGSVIFCKLVIMCIFPAPLSLLNAMIESLFSIQGLITEERQNIDPEALPFARKIKEANRQGLREGASLVEVVCINVVF